MNRALKNKTRGKQRSDAVDTPAPAEGLLLSRYNGRENYGAGTINQRAIKPLQPDGVLANWMGNTPPN